MRLFLTLLYFLITAPVEIGFRAFINDMLLPSGVVYIVIYGLSLQFPFYLKNEHSQIWLYIKLRQNGRLRRIAVKRKKTGKQLLIHVLPPLQRHLVSFARKEGVTLRIGTGNAAVTALLCAMLSNLCRFSFPLYIQPLFQLDSFTAQIKCISHFRLGKLWITAALLFIARLKRNLSGGKSHGNAKSTA